MAWGRLFRVGGEGVVDIGPLRGLGVVGGVSEGGAAAHAVAMRCARDRCRREEIVAGWRELDRRAGTVDPVGTEERGSLDLD